MTQFASHAEDIGSGSQPADPTTEWENVDDSSGRSCFQFPKKKNALTILLIGETGSGKTSFMSLLLNLFQGNGPFELEDKHFVNAQSGLNRSQSQTTEARLYSPTTNNGLKVEILDTPGLADTRGIEEDKKHKERIYQAIQDLITVIDGVMIIANGRVERLSVTTDYTLNILATLFPRSILDNIGIIFTNTGAGGAGLNFQTESLPSELQKVQHWCLDNPLSLYKTYSAQRETGQLSGAKGSRQKRNLEDSYDDAIDSLGEWLEWLDGRKEIPTTAIVELYQKSSHIESSLFATLKSIADLSKFKSQLQDILSDLQGAGVRQEFLTDWKQEVSPKRWVLEETPHHNTICTAPDCHSNCHINCSLEVGGSATIGGSCEAFRTLWITNKWLPFWSNARVKCNQAKCGHEAQEHRYYRGIHKQEDNQDYIKLAKYLNDAITKKAGFEEVKIHIEQEIARVKKEIERSKGEIHKLIEELNSISLSPNYAGYIRSALDVLKMRREHLRSRPDSSNELAVINDGIQAFEAQLNLLQENEAGRVVETSAKGTGIRS
ncbi:unnamed protein product [Rhizoctonia solani]|uniref:AIG1-type G domain-containing protein n=1 Tax=Rhizoctonia solani TaxID=456999 RepID=A0A8H2WXP0_9AGAM|nr:unnamed protein product [Rhizoctonia solani]